MGQGMEIGLVAVRLLFLERRIDGVDGTGGFVPNPLIPFFRTECGGRISKAVEDAFGKAFEEKLLLQLHLSEQLRGHDRESGQGWVVIGKWRLIFNGFDFCFLIAASFLFLNGADGAIDLVGEPFQFTEDERKQGRGVRHNRPVFCVHCNIQQVFHLQEAELEVDEVVDEDVFDGSDRFILLQQIIDDGQTEIGVVNVVFEVGEAEEAMFERVGGRPRFAGRSARAGGLFRIGAVGGETSGGAGFVSGGWVRRGGRIGNFR